MDSRSAWAAPSSPHGNAIMVEAQSSARAFLSAYTLVFFLSLDLVQLPRLGVKLRKSLSGIRQYLSYQKTVPEPIAEWYLLHPTLHSR